MERRKETARICVTIGTELLEHLRKNGISRSDAIKAGGRLLLAEKFPDDVPYDANLLITRRVSRLAEKVQELAKSMEGLQK